MLRRKLFLLSVFYLVQGMPYGFMITPLPVYLREQDMSLTRIALLGTLMSLPWILKVIWGPLVDRFGSPRFGRRRSWIAPLQAGLAASCAVAAFTPPEARLEALLAAIFLMNLFAATMDVAVDGLAVDLLEPRELGYGNIAQVVGYKLGMMTGGGLLITAGPALGGWQGIFFAMAGLTLLALIVTLFFRENAGAGAAEPSHEPRPSFGDILRRVGGTFRLPGALWLLIFIATYKLGETFADAMFRPFLSDAGFTVEQISHWVGTWGLGFSLAGSVAGGILASRLGLFPALALTAALRALAVGGEWWLSLVEPTLPRMIGVTTAEQFFGGALTTATFAYMMSRVDRRIGATHFTLLATVEVFGKLAAGSISGKIADLTSYPALFGLSTLLAACFLLLLVPLYRTETPRRSLDPEPPMA